MSDYILPHGIGVESIIPTGGRVLILPREKTYSALEIAPADRFKHESYRGTIIRVAEDVWDVHEGQDVIFNPYSQSTVEIDNNILYMVHESDIVAVMPPNAGARSARLRNSSKRSH